MPSVTSMISHETGAGLFGSLQESIRNLTDGLMLTAGLLEKPFKKFVRITAIRLVWLLILIYCWKMVSMDWLVTIPITSGGTIHHRPPNSPAWKAPRPTPPFTSFEKEAIIGFVSGAGPSVNPGTARLSPDWYLIGAEVILLMIVFSLILMIRGLWVILCSPWKPLER